MPPKSIGGSVIILTCKRCNNQAGYTFEQDLVKRREVHAQAKCLLEQLEGEFGHVKLKINGIALNANLSRRGGVTNFEITDHNNPNSLEASRAALMEFAEGSEINVSTSKSYKRRNIEKSDLKAAFLAISAKFGYTVAFEPRMVPIRRAILGYCDHEEFLQYIELPTSSAGSILVDEESGIAAMIIEERGVVIPWPSQPLTNFKKRGEKLKIQAKVFDFPTFFEAQIDLRHPQSPNLLG